MTEKEAEEALDWLQTFIQAWRKEITMMAAGRFAEGVFRYPHGPLFAKRKEDLMADVAEEIADAAVYAWRWLTLDRQGK